MAKDGDQTVQDWNEILRLKGGRDKMYCPMKFNSNTLDIDGTLREKACQCEQSDCAFWEINTATCGIVTNAFLQGRAVYIAERRAEAKAMREDRY